MKLKLIIGLLLLSSGLTVYGQKSWDGGALSTNWGDAANWLPDGVPASTDNVTIGSSYTVLVNTNTATCKNLIVDGTLGYQNVATRSLTVTGDVSGAGIIDMTNATATGFLYLQGTNNAISSFVPGSLGTVTYNGTGIQNIAAWNYNNLTIAGAHTTNNVIFPTSGEVGIANVFTISGATFTTGTMVTTSSTIRYSGNVAQNILANTALFAYNNLTVSIPSGASNRTKTLAGAVVVGGNLVVESLDGTSVCSLEPASYNLTVNGTTTINARGTLLDGNNTGTNTFTGKLTVATNGSVSSANTSAYVFSGGITNNGSFSITGAGTKTFSLNSQNLDGSSPISLAGSVTISGAISVINLSTVTLTGALDGNNASSQWVNGAGSTLNYASGTVPFTTLGGWNVSTNLNTVVYNGAAQNIKGGSYSSLTFSVSGTKTLMAATDIAQTFTLSGTAGIACGINNLNLNGPVSYTSTGTLASGANTVTYNYTSTQDVIPGNYSGNLLLQGTGAKTLKGAITAANDVVIPSGIIFSTNNFAATLSGNLTINAGGIFNVNSNVTGSGSLLMATAKTITNKGVFAVVGTSTFPAIVSHVSGNYSIIQNAATATFQAKYYQFNYLNGGIVISDGGIDATNNFSNGSFSNGLGTQYLSLQGLDLSTLPTVSTVVFNAGPTYNITRTTGTGAITLADATGALAGENFDNDDSNPGSHVIWGFPATTYYSNPLGTFRAGKLTDWTSNPDGSGTTPSSLTDGSASLVIQNGHIVTLDATNGNINVKELQVGQGVSGILTFGDDVTQRTLTVQQKLDIKAGATVYAGTVGTTPHLLKLYGNIYNQGSILFNNLAGQNINVEVYGTASSIQGTNTPILNDITFKAASNSGTKLPLDIRGNVIIETTAIFNDGDQTLTVKGNWSEAGTGQRTGNGAVVFNGTLNTIINGGSSGGAVFNQVEFSGGGAGAIQDNITINGNFNLTNNTTVQINNFTNSVIGNFNVDFGSTFTQTANTTTLAGTAVQNLTASGTVTFYNLTLANGGTNSKTLTGTIALSGQLSLLAGATTDGNADLTIAGGIRLDGTCNWSGTVNATGGTIQTTNASNFNSLGSALLNVNGNVTLGYTAPATSFQLSVGNSVNIQTGNLWVSNYTTLVGTVANALNLSAGVSLYVRGADNFPTGFGTYSLNPTSLVRYDWNIDQTVRGGINYGILYLDDNSSTSTWNKIADGVVNILGYLDLNGAINFTLNGFAMNVAGNIYNLTNSSVLGATATITMNAPDANQTIEASGTGSYNFQNLVFTLDGVTTSRTKNIQTGTILNLSGDFIINNTNGSPTMLHIVDIADVNMGGTPVNFKLGSNCQLNTTNTAFGANVMDKFTGTKILDATSTVYYSLSGTQSIADGFSYGNITFNGGDKTAEGALDINGKIWVSGGTPVFFDAGFTHTIAGDWSLGTANYTAASATGTIVLDGINQNVTSTNFRNLIINNSGSAVLLGTVNVLGDITLNDNSNLDGNIRDMYIYGNWQTTGSGVFTQTTGREYFVGAANQTLQTNNTSTFGNITINKPNAVGSQKVTLLSDLVVNSNIYLTANAGVLDISNKIVRIGGRLDVTGNSVETGLTFISDGSTVIFNGTFNQYAYNTNANPLTFNNIEFDGSGPKFFGWNGLPGVSNVVNVNGNVTINGSSFGASGWTYDQDYYVKGNWTNNGTFTHGAGRTVYFNGTSQTISASSFGSVSFNHNNTKTLTGNITVSGSLTIADTATLDPNGYNINLSGNWVNSAPEAKYNTSTETVILEGYGSTLTTGTITGPLAGKSFNNIVINKIAGNYASLAGDIDIKNDFTINSGGFTTNAFDVWLAGNLNNTGGVFNHNNNSSLLTLNAVGGTKTFNPGSNALLYPLRGITLNAPGATYQVANSFIISQNQDFTITDGYFDLNGHLLQLNTNNQRIILNGGTLDIDAASMLTFTGTTQSVVNNGGTLRIVGTSSSYATVNRVGGTYTITQNSGTIHAGYYKFDYPNGVIIAGGSIDATNNFSDGTFSSGGGAAYLTLTGLNCGDISVSNVVFNSGPTYNVRRLSGTGTVTMADATGTLSGETNDDDGGTPGSVLWTNPGGFYWDGGAGDTDWHKAANWSGDVVPDTINNVYLNHKYVTGAYTVSINAANAKSNRLILDAQGGAAITLRLQNGRDLDANGSVVVNTSTTFDVTDPNSEMTVAGNWSNAGTFNHGNSTVTFDGKNSSFTIATGGNGAGKKFYNLGINAPGATYALTNPADMDNNLNVNAGTFDLASLNNDIWVGGNWNINTTNGAVFDPDYADVTFDGTNQTINNGPFYNFLTATSGTKKLLANTAIDGTVTIGSGTIFDAQDKNVFVNGNWINNGGSFSHTGLGLLNFSGTGTQQIDNGTATTTFFNVTFSNSGAKNLLKSNLVKGDFIVNPGSGIVDVYTNQITGVGTNSFILGNGSYFRLRGANNFPATFAAYNLSSNSTVDYYSDLDQIIAVSPSWSYGNLRIFDATNLSAPSTKTAQAGNLTLTGSLTVGDIRSLLDMNTNSTNMILSGTISFPTGGLQINWGTGTSTLTHIGADWTIDRDITGFNNIIFSGSGYKWTQGDLVITGDVTIKNGINFRMQEGWGPPPVPHTITGNASKSFTMENGSSLTCPVTAVTSPAFAIGFGTYNIGQNSTVYINGYEDQILYTGNGIVYGNLDLGGYGRNVTMDGVANLDVNGWFNSSSAVLSDAGKNMSVAGTYAYLNYYTPSATSTFSLDGVGAQTLYDGATNVTTNTTFDFANVVFSGSGTKTFGDGNDVINISGNTNIATGVTVISGRVITFSGSTWTNKGIFQHTANSITFSNAAAQSIEPGPSNALNYFNNTVFTGAGAKKFIVNGADINGTLTITDGSLDLSNFDYTIGGSVTNTTGGILSSAQANITFDGGTQNINTPAFQVNNVTIANNGTKRMFSNWTVNGNLTITSLTALNTSDAVLPTFYDINIKGNWINNGTYTSNTSKVTFSGSTSPISITSNGSSFYNVEFAPTASTQYNLLSPLSRISRAMDLRSLATLNLNSQILILGNNIASGKVYTVEGTLNVNQNATLKFNSQTSQSVMNVTGKLNLLGTNPTNIASITREVAGVTGLEAQINILSGGTMAAQYYLIEYLQDAGLNMATGSILDATNNFSNGRFSNIRNAAGVCYLNLEANYSGGTISNICFDFSGTPVKGVNYNVRRNTASTAVTFDLVSGNLGNYLFEDDEETVPAANSGHLRWPALTSTTWIGGISTDWHTAGNWGNGIPTALLDAIIPAGSPNNPKITIGDAVCKNLNITTGSLSLENGKKITTSGDINIGVTGNGILAVNSSTCEIVCGGFWTRGATGMFVNGSGTVRFVSSAGTANITPLTSNFYNVIIDNPTTTFNLVGAALTIKGSVDIKNGTLTPVNNGYVYNVEGDFTVENGVFLPVAGTVTAGTVVFNGSSTQNITNVNFYNLTISGSNTKATHGPVTISNNTIVNSILKAEAGSNIDFNGNVLINAGGLFNDGDETHTFTGTSWTGTGDYAGNGTIVFDRTAGNQSVYASKFANLDINCQTRVLTFYGNVAITGDAVVRDLVNYVNFGDYLLSTSSSAGTFTVETTASLYLTGYDVFPAGFSTYNISPNCNTYYRGAADQLVAGVNYGILNLQNANVKTLKGDIGVQNTLNFNASTLDVSSNNYTITLSGTWNNGGAGTFIPRNGEVRFEGATPNQYIYVGTTATNPFWDITVDKTSGNVVAGSGVTYTIQDNLTVDNGVFNANGRPVEVGNNMIASGAGTFSKSGTFILTKASGTASLQTNGSTLNNLTINAGTGASIIALDNLRADGNVVVQSGTFDANGKYMQLGYSGNSVTISGTYKVGAGGTLALGYNCSLTVNSGGIFDIIGNSGSSATVSRNVNNWTGSYRFTVDGTIKAQYAMFEYMSGQSNGIYITSNGTIDPVNNFSNCAFNYGSASGAMLTIENTQSFTGANAIMNASFPTTPGGSGKNVRKNVSTAGVVEFYNAIGVFAGENYDDDPYNLINWTGPITLTWNGSVSTDWFTAGNWTASSGPGFVPTGAENVFIAPALNQPILTTFGAVTAHLTINASANLTLSTPEDGAAIDLTVNGDLTINGTLREVLASDYLTIKGNWVRNGITQLYGNVMFDGSGASKLINNGNYPFYNLIIAGSTPYKIFNGSIIKNNLTINAGGELDAYPSSYLYVAGNWTNSGTFSPSTGKVILNSTAGTQAVNSGSSAFYDLDINAGVVCNLSGVLNINRTLNLNGTLDLNAQTLNMGDNSGVDYLNVYGTLNIGANSNLRMGASSYLQVQTGGFMNIIGTDESNPANITHQSGTYAFDVLSGGTLAAKYYNIDYLNINGLWMHSGAVLDTVSKRGLSLGTFSNGAAGGQYLKFENDFGGNITISDITFNSGPLYNISRKTGTNIVSVRDASGTVGAFLYEDDQTGIPDPNTGLIFWTYVNTYIWTGAVDHNWHNTGNWMTNLVPDNTKSAIIPNVTNYPQITASTAVAKKLTLYQNARIEISQDFTLAADITNDGAMVAIGSPVITVGGGWSGTYGSFTSATSKVVFNAPSGNKTIYLGTGNFYDMETNAGASTIFQFGAATAIRRNLSINTGTLDGSNYDLTVGGSWTATGSFIPGLHTVTLNAASGTQALNNGANNFYNLIVYSGSGTGTAAFNMGSALNVTKNFTLRKGTLDVSPDGGTSVYNINIGNRSIINGGTLTARSSTITVGENWQVSSPGVFTCGTGSVIVNSLTGTRSITPGNSPFYNLTVNTGGTYRISYNTVVNNNCTIAAGTVDMSLSPTYNLTVGGNWTNNGTFITRTSLVTLNGTSQTVSHPGGELFYNLTIANNSALSLMNNVGVANTFTFTSGKITTGTNVFTVGTGVSTPGTFAYTAGTVIGKFEQWVTANGLYRFPVGTSTNTQMVNLTINSGLASGSLMMEFVATDPGSNGLPLAETGRTIINQFTEGYWNATARNGMAVADYNLALQANGFSSYYFGSDVAILKRINGGAWVFDGAHAPASSPNVYRNNFTGGITASSTQFCIGNPDCMGGQIGSNQSICQNQDVAAFSSTTAAKGGANTFTYTWQYTTTTTAVAGDANWTDITGSNTSAYDYGTLALSTRFIRKASGTGCLSDKYSNIISITVSAVPATGPLYRKPNN